MGMAQLSRSMQNRDANAEHKSSKLRTYWLQTQDDGGGDAEEMMVMAGGEY